MSVFPQKAVRHTFFSLAGQIVNFAAGFFLTAYLARRLGVEGFSYYSLILTYPMLFLPFVDWGLTTIAVREISRDPQKTTDYLRAAFTLAALSAAAVWIICLVSWRFMEFPLFATRDIAIYALILLACPFNVMNVLNQSQFRSDLSVAASVASRILLVAGTLVIMETQAGIGWLFALGASVFGFEIILNGVFIKGWPHIGFAFRADLLRSLAKEAFPIGLIGLFSTLINRLDVLFISHFSGLHEIGVYTAPFRIIFFVNFLPQAVMASFFPLISETQGKKPGSGQDLYHRTLELLVFLAIPGIAGGCILADKIVLLALGPEFSASVPVFRILIWQTGTVFAAIVPATVLTAHGLQRENLKLNAAAAALSVVLNLFLIPRMGAQGAAVTNLCVHAFLMTGTFACLRHRTEMSIPWPTLLRLGAEAFAITGIIYLLRDFPLQTVVPAAAALTALLAYFHLKVSPKGRPA